MNDKYLQYSLNDFLEDENFIASVNNGTLDKSEWDQKFADHPDTQKSFDDAFKLISKLKFKSDHMEENRVDQLWNKIHQDISRKKPQNNKVLIRSIIISGVAASLILLIVWMGSFISQNKQVSSYAGEHINYQLPDESNITLNAISYIHYNPDKFDRDRKVEMEGEVRFEVSKGEDFVVNTPMGQVEVLGTVFNVYSRDSLFEVKCFEGIVRVITQEKDTFMLQKHQGVNYSFSTGLTKEFNLVNEDLNDWSKGQFRFTNRPLNEIFTELERQFNIRIKLDDTIDSENRFYTGLFTNTNLEEALHAVCWPLRLEYEINGKQVLIKQP